MTESAALERLTDAVAFWEVNPIVGPDEVIESACDALVAGVDSPSLRELAGLSVKDSYWTLRPLVEATFDELSVAYPGPGNDEVEIAAARVMCKRLLEDRLTARQFVSWAHFTIGHQGAARLQPIVELDDAYDVLEYTGDTEDDLDGAARREATSLLAGEPLPAGTAPNQTRMAATAGTASRLRSALRRMMTRLSR